jgi:hypothetical protein
MKSTAQKHAPKRSSIRTRDNAVVIHRCRGTEVVKLADGIFLAFDPYGDIRMAITPSTSNIKLVSDTQPHEAMDDDGEDLEDEEDEDVESALDKDFVVPDSSQSDVHVPRAAKKSKHVIEDDSSEGDLCEAEPEIGDFVDDECGEDEGEDEGEEEDEMEDHDEACNALINDSQSDNDALISIEM